MTRPATQDEVRAKMDDGWKLISCDTPRGTIWWLWRPTQTGYEDRLVHSAAANGLAGCRLITLTYRRWPVTEWA